MQVNVILYPVGVTVKVPENTITTTHNKKLYRRVGQTLIFTQVKEGWKQDNE